MIIQISSRTNDKIKHVVSLRNKKNRQDEGLFVAEGKKALELALKSGLVKEVYTLKSLKLPAEIAQYIITKEILEKISSSVTPEGIVFVAEIPEQKLLKKDKLIYLDEIQDPGNLGTIMRTALAFDYDGVILSKNCVDPYNDKAISASKGAIFMMPFVVDDLANYKSSNEIIVSALDDDAVSIDDLEVNEPFVIVVGNEANGVKEETKLLADKKVIIPIKNIDSLNVAVAAGILMQKLA